MKVLKTAADKNTRQVLHEIIIFNDNILIKYAIKLKDFVHRMNNTFKTK